MAAMSPCLSTISCRGAGSPVKWRRSGWRLGRRTRRVATDFEGQWARCVPHGRTRTTTSAPAAWSTGVRVYGGRGGRGVGRGSRPGPGARAAAGCAQSMYARSCRSSSGCSHRRYRYADGDHHRQPGGVDDRRRVDGPAGRPAGQVGAQVDAVVGAIFRSPIDWWVERIDPAGRQVAGALSFEFGVATGTTLQSSPEHRGGAKLAER